MTFHSGERELQRRAGVESMAARVGRIIRDQIPGEWSDFLEQQRMLVLGYRDLERRVRVSLITGRPGFARVAGPRTLRVDGPALPPGEAAVLAIDFQDRSRMRLNGRLEASPGGFLIQAREVYGNCAKYIQARSILEERPVRPSEPRLSAALGPQQRERILQADTFFIATVPPGQAADVSHRGGNPGFVRILDERRLEWDDYSGNAMFNTLGNLQLDPEAGLLFVDFDQGTHLELGGRATVRGERQRKVELEIREVRETPDAHPFCWSRPDYSPFNPR